MRLWGGLVVGVAIALLAAAPASACATCFGASDSPLTEGMNGAILTLLGVVAFVQVGFVALFVRFVIRARRLRERKERFRLIRGGAR